ncbi:hypothetical protein ACTI_59300 [Actinoplanes sp. OR16]|uniref:hypothetical protein n=1 Tax=Actinoplanes sp. OR16 TaxID=946334 RepID=UPI000F6D2BF1|nr:hypothetical protein [Actinoplanes sp. OR16]BBH69245.1 hypothetical protein ACTI_59300 [Actinoplanes sp. OR16]
MNADHWAGVARGDLANREWAALPFPTAQPVEGRQDGDHQEVITAIRRVRRTISPWQGLTVG